MSEYKIGKIIIIAIEHAEDRINEYNVGRTVLGKGQGKKHSVCTKTLKPFVDNNFQHQKIELIPE
jgi:hypothetical protein